MPFVDLLHNVWPDESMELLLHTPGGNIDAAEKLIRMVRSKVGEAEFYIIVPEFAKSAGTLMVLGADRVVMSDMSELGPIDPQLPFPDSYGKVRWQTVQNYLDAYDEYTKTLTEQPGNVAAQVMLGKLDPAIVKLCQAVKERARQCAGDLLKRGMFREGGNWTLTVSELIDTKRWLSHSQMISWEDAQHPDTIGLVVEYLDQQSEEWQEYWRLYCLQRFGPLIDAYTIPQSVADGATVPIWYEARLPELAVEGPETLDRLYEAMFGDEPPAVQAQIRRRYANKETVAEAERRIEMIALDIAEHFKGKVRPNGFKAQVVAPSRAAALRYAEHLNSFGLRAYPVITAAPNDGPEFKAARELDQEQVVNAFVDPEGEPEALVVVDMLLAGFDAPVEQALYLDRALREHGLLQAIARVNRRFSHEQDGVATEKTHGLVVDYHGVSRDLEEALSTFDWPDVQDTMREMDEDPAPVIEAAAVQAESHFKERDLGDTWACVSVFAPDALTEGNFKADLFERFNADYRRFSLLMDRFLPDPRALDYTDRLARLTEIRAYVRAQFLREDADADWTEIGAKGEEAGGRAHQRQCPPIDEAGCLYSTKTSSRRSPHSPTMSHEPRSWSMQSGRRYMTAWPTTPCSSRNSRRSLHASSKTFGTG